MQLRLSRKILFYIFLIFFLSTLNNKYFSEIKFKTIDEIMIVGLEGSEKQNLLSSLKLLNLRNIFFLDKFEIINKLETNKRIENYTIFKRYPSSIEIKIEKTNFLASTNINGKNYLVGSNGKFINTQGYSKNLPFVFGNFEIKKFLELKNIILQTDFKYNKIKNFYYFPSGRWDIEMISGVLIKLPIIGIKDSLNLSIDLLDDIEFTNIKILDIRQKNQIVIND